MLSPSPPPGSQTPIHPYTVRSSSAQPPRSRTQGHHNSCCRTTSPDLSNYGERQVSHRTRCSIGSTQHPDPQPEGYDPQNWTVIGGGDFKAFWALHWGKDELSRLRTKPLAERFLSIARTRDVLDLIQGPPSADPSLLFRDEYDSFIKHLDAAWQNKATTGMRGCLLLGQPAIGTQTRLFLLTQSLRIFSPRLLSSGTSCSLLFLLIHCLSRKQAVLFTTSSGRTFRFDERGVATIMASEFAGCLHLPPRTHANEPTFWSLVDRPESEVLVLSPVTKGTGRLFFVAAAISDPDDTSHWDPSIGSYQMEPWSKEELLAL